MWAIVKSCLNSTLGTSSFLSLDKMIENAKIYLGNKIDTNQTNIMNGIEGISVSTTGVGKVLHKQSVLTQDSWSGTYIDKFIAPVGGLYKIQMEVTANTYSGIKYLSLNKACTNKFSYIKTMTDTSSSGSGWSYETSYDNIDGETRYYNSVIGENTVIPSFEKIHTTTKVKEFNESINVGVPTILESYICASAGEPVLLYLYDMSSELGYVEKGLQVNKIISTITYGNS